MPYTYTTQSEVRAAFFDAYPRLKRRGATHDDYPTDTRCAFVDFVDYLQRSGEISELLAERVTL